MWSDPPSCCRTTEGRLVFTVGEPGRRVNIGRPFEKNSCRLTVRANPAAFLKSPERAVPCPALPGGPPASPHSPAGLLTSSPFAASPSLVTDSAFRYAGYNAASPARVAGAARKRRPASVPACRRSGSGRRSRHENPVPFPAFPCLSSPIHAAFRLHSSVAAWLHVASSRRPETSPFRSIPHDRPCPGRFFPHDHFGTRIARGERTGLFHPA